MTNEDFVSTYIEVHDNSTLSSRDKAIIDIAEVIYNSNYGVGMTLRSALMLAEAIMNYIAHERCKKECTECIMYGGCTVFKDTAFVIQFIAKLLRI